MSAKDAILLHPADNVATALRRIENGEHISVAGSDRPVKITAAEAIPIFHKVAIRSLTSGVDIVKYGDSIGVLIADADQGALVHVHNLKSRRAATS